MAFLLSLKYYLSGNFKLKIYIYENQRNNCNFWRNALLLGSCSTVSIKNAKLVTENDTLSYAIGL